VKQNFFLLTANEPGTDSVRIVAEFRMAARERGKSDDPGEVKEVWPKLAAHVRSVPKWPPASGKWIEKCVKKYVVDNVYFIKNRGAAVNMIRERMAIERLDDDAEGVVERIIEVMRRILRKRYDELNDLCFGVKAANIPHRYNVIHREIGKFLAKYG